MSCAETAEPIDLPFELWLVDPGGPKEAQVQSYSPGGANVPTTWRIRLNRPSVAAMRSYVKLLWPLNVIICRTLSRPTAYGGYCFIRGITRSFGGVEYAEGCGEGSVHNRRRWICTHLVYIMHAHDSRHVYRPSQLTNCSFIIRKCVRISVCLSVRSNAEEGLFTRTERYCSFIQHALKHY